MDESTLLTLGIVAVVAAIWLGIALFSYGALVAVVLFSWAAESAGFVGIALYILLWVLATPLMIVICAGGAVVLAILSLRHKLSNEIKPKLSLKQKSIPHPKPGDHDYFEWANREGKWSE